ncbi:uncharacterized protein IL334_001550 [Kwoniella shivajii]|uniref:Mediator of RNA polymerase II transcription subunit 11 n=1 Tax=Kwoniella shivajii TaxID=564305 RepID=A0ABZ1CWF3_9TREE|nr:hypothetical protein IL334_001550 [Kwoniella shivajii]
MSSPAGSISDGLELDSLDSESLFMALTNVEKAIPELLLCIKPILSHLVSPSNQVDGNDDEETSGIEAREAVERYMTLLDKIQFVLRQTVYYLHATRISPQTLRPPEINNIPTPFASTLPSSRHGSEGLKATEGDERGVEVGLYASRIEERVLGQMAAALRALNDEGRNM